jgi:hypothetical protein
MPDRVPSNDREHMMGQYARTLLQIEMKKRGLKYRDLTEKLNINDPNENERNVRNKIARGTFSAGFFVSCLLAMGCKTLPLGFEDTVRKRFGLMISETDDQVE